MKVIEIGGRKLQMIAEANVAHDTWIMQQISLAGLDTLDFDAGKPPEAAVDSIVDRVVQSGMAMTLLGGLLMPVGVAATDWTPTIAADVIAFLNALSAKEDRLAVRGAVAEAIICFFYAGLISLKTSRMSSVRNRGPASAIPQDLIGAR